jgi:hypothetical protein
MASSMVIWGGMSLWYSIEYTAMRRMATSTRFNRSKVQCSKMGCYGLVNLGHVFQGSGNDQPGKGLQLIIQGSNFIIPKP